MTTPDRFTRTDYDRLPEGFPAQLVEGLLVRDPSLVPWHQWLSSRLYLAFCGAVGPDRALYSPVDFPIDDENVYQPDVVVFAGPVERGPHVREIETPLLVVEVLSPSTAAYDRGVKARRYLLAGVREVWLVDPVARTVEVCASFGSTTSGPGMVAASAAMPGFALDVDTLFLVSCVRNS